MQKRYFDINSHPSWENRDAASVKDVSNQGKIPAGFFRQEEWSVSYECSGNSGVSPSDLPVKNIRASYCFFFAFPIS
jgi:hypothetical protein